MGLELTENGAIFTIARNSPRFAKAEKYVANAYRILQLPISRYLILLKSARVAKIKDLMHVESHTTPLDGTWATTCAFVVENSVMSSNFI